MSREIGQVNHLFRDVLEAIRKQAIAEGLALLTEEEILEEIRMRRDEDEDEDEDEDKDKIEDGAPS